MLPRESTQIDEQSSVPSSFDYDDDGELDEAADDASPVYDEPPQADRRSWRRVCAAKRSIERMLEQQALKAALDDVFDEDSYWDISDDD